MTQKPEGYFDQFDEENYGNPRKDQEWKFYMQHPHYDTTLGGVNAASLPRFQGLIQEHLQEVRVRRKNLNP